jgi:hypothetical protein
MTLNSKLFPEDSPIARNHGLKTAMDFDSENDPVSKIRRAAIGNAEIGTAAIGTANIGTLSFNEIYGGTATLGGTANGNGVMKVLNASGGTAVIADSSGVTVYGGSITIQNTSGSNTLDSKGIVSINGFSFTNGTSGASTVTGSSEYYLPGGTITYALTRSAVVIYFWKYQGYKSGGTTDTGNITTRLRVNTNDVGRIAWANGLNDYSHTVSNFLIRQESAGTITANITGQLESIVGTPSFNYVDWGLSYIILGT